MAWDPVGERLAVIFKDEDKHAQELVAVFKTRLKPTFEIMPRFESLDSFIIAE